MSRALSPSMKDLIADLFPICRSITGDGVRATLSRMQSVIPLEVKDIPSGTQVFDWKVPREWNIRDAFLVGPDGQKVVDFKDNNLQVMSYSRPIDQELELAELSSHLYSLPEQPDLIPYRTSYYSENWGFCLADRVKSSLPEGRYRAVIDSSFSEGALTYGELLVPGTHDTEFLVYSHVCHPSLANDNLSGVAVTAMWAKHLLESGGNRVGFRFVWGPGTIGSIAWLAANRECLHRIRYGLVVVLVGRPGQFRYKSCRNAPTTMDRAALRVLSGTRSGVEAREFDPYGYDERQFNSPGINLPVGRLSRAPNGEYPEYHTSGDNLTLISEEALEEALSACISIGDQIDSDRFYVNQEPFGEPQLGKRGLYRGTGGDSPRDREYAILWILSLSDGSHSVNDIAERSGLPLDTIVKVSSELEANGLLREQG